MSRFEKMITLAAFVLAFLFGVVPSAQAMHIMEGFLAPKWCIMWGVLTLPFFVIGLFSIKRIISQDAKVKMLLAMAGAFTFVLSALKIPSVTGSSSHPTGVGFGSIVFGPTAMVVIGVIVLLFQALLLAHGGLTTLGANSFSMAIAGPFVAFGVYKLVRKLKGPQWLAVFLAAALADLITYVVTSFQLALAFPDPIGGFFASFSKFLGIFAVTQIPLAISEGILTVLIIQAISAYKNDEYAQFDVLYKGVAE